MMHKKIFAQMLLLCIMGGALFSPVAAQHDHHVPATAEIGDLGELTFENSGSPAAQSHFLRGVLLLHSFQHQQAVEEFQRAQKADPGFAMAYWGEAMSYNRNFGRQQDRAAAVRVLAKLGSTREERLAKAPTAREKAYLDAVLALYGEGAKPDRDAAYASAMERLAASYPQDLEARAFYALALISVHGRNPTTAIRAAAIAEEIFALNPRHPGAAHYLIHAYDDPVHAPLGVRAARAYSRLAPGAPHALHMPAHIFFRLGMWDESIAANLRSLAAERRSGRIGTHVMHWLVHAYLQQGQRDDAASILRTLENDLKRPEISQPGRYAKAQICAVWVIETASDGDVPCDKAIDRTGIAAIGTFVEYEMARGLVAARRHDLTDARAALSRIQDMIDRGRAQVTTESAPTPMEQVTAQDLEISALMSMQLEAAILFAEGRREDGLKRAAEAVAKSDALPFRTEPPAVPKPTRELLGELLLAAGRFEDARVQFDAALERTPARLLTLVGLLKALERSGNWDRAALVRAEIQRQRRGGGKMVPQIR